MAPTLEERRAATNQIKSTLSQAQDIYSQYAGGAGKIPELARQELLKKTQGNKAIIEQENRLKAERATVATDVGAELAQGGFAGNPMIAAQAKAKREAGILERMNNLKQVRQERTGTFADIIGAATGAYQAETQGAQARVQGLQTQYGMEYGELQDQIQQEAQQRAFEENKREFDLEFAAKQEQQRKEMELQENALDQIDLGDRIAWVDRNGNIVKTERKGRSPGTVGVGDGDNTEKESLKLLANLNEDLSYAYQNPGNFVGDDHKSNREGLIRSLANKYGSIVSPVEIAERVYSGIRTEDEGEYKGLDQGMIDRLNQGTF